jgi:hypothetical protein
LQNEGMRRAVMAGLAVALLGYAGVLACSRSPSVVPHDRSQVRNSPAAGPTAAVQSSLDLPAPRTYLQACLLESQVCSCRSEVGDCSAGPDPGQLFRQLHLPAVGLGGACPTTPGSAVSGGGFQGIALGSGSVRSVISAPGDPSHGVVQLFKDPNDPWLSFKTLWFSVPGYAGPWRVAGARIDAEGSIAFGEGPRTSELVVPPFPTINGTGGYRTAPGGTFVKAPGCYAWQVDGMGFSDVIVFLAVSPT